MLLGAAIPATAAVTVENLLVRPNPVRLVKGAPAEVEFEITVKDRGMTRILGCDLILDFGDGTPVASQRFMDGGPRKAVIKHVYDKPGGYSVSVRGRQEAGGRPCEADRRMQVTVIADAPSEPPPPPKEAATAIGTCPAGWSIVPGSQAGLRFKCRADHPMPRIECQGGTKYFEQDGLIGCQ